MSIPRIVIVEDNLPDVMVFREALARRGIAFTIEHFTDGERASDAIASMTAGPDLFILDLNLPRIDGLQLLRQIREHQPTARSVVAILTTSRAPEDRTRCEALGADAYLVKPAGFNEFMDLVGNAVHSLLSQNAAGAGTESEVPEKPAAVSPARAARAARTLRPGAVRMRARRPASGKTRAAQSTE